MITGFNTFVHLQFFLTFFKSIGIVLKNEHKRGRQWTFKYLKSSYDGSLQGRLGSVLE